MSYSPIEILRDLYKHSQKRGKRGEDRGAEGFMEINSIYTRHLRGAFFRHLEEEICPNLAVAPSAALFLKRESVYTFVNCSPIKPAFSAS